MAFNLYQFQEYIVKPSLAAIDLYSENAMNLILGTCAQESGFGTYLTQRMMRFEGGIGVYQMQSQAYHATWYDKVQSNYALQSKIKLFLGYDGKPAVQRLASDLCLATIMCRLYYAQVKEPLPAVWDIEGMARYWKKWYNSPAGKGTTDEFIANYKKYVTID